MKTDSASLKRYDATGATPETDLWAHFQIQFKRQSSGGGRGGAPPKADVRAFQVKIDFMKPDAETWNDSDKLPEKQVILFDQDTRIRIRVTNSFSNLAQMTALPEFSKLSLKTSLTKPSSIEYPLTNQNCVFVTGTSYNEVHIILTREKLKTLGLLASHHNLGKAWLDDGSDDPNSDANLSDGEAFAAGAPGQARGKSTKFGDLDSDTPNSPGFDKSFVQAAGAEIMSAKIAGVSSAKREIMNQADYLYLSVEGSHSNNYIYASYSGGLMQVTPEDVMSYWNKGLSTVIFAGCAILDINDYNNNYDGDEHTHSPGKEWAASGVNVLLGYDYLAPHDKSGGTQIIQEWLQLTNQENFDKINAWEHANQDAHAWNACAIANNKDYYYFYAVTVIGFPVGHKWEKASTPW